MAPVPAAVAAAGGAGPSQATAAGAAAWVPSWGAPPPIQYFIAHLGGIQSRTNMLQVLFYVFEIRISKMAKVLLSLPSPLDPAVRSCITPYVRFQKMGG